MKISIVGLGVIGGSIAKALSRSGKHLVVGFDMDEDILLEAKSAGAINRNGTEEDFADSDVVYICLYPQGTIDYVEKNKSYFGKNTVVADVCGIKASVYNELKSIAEKNDFIYVGTHPMAGKEKNSFFASESGLFYGASYIIIKDNISDIYIERLTSLANEMEFGKIIYTDVAEHDRMIAFTSQVPHILACSYVMSPMCENHKGFSAGSYRDVSRVAYINADLWTDLFLCNKQPLVDELDILLDNIKSIRDAVNADDREKLNGLLQKARKIKEKDF